MFVEVFTSSQLDRDDAAFCTSLFLFLARFLIPLNNLLILEASHLIILEPAVSFGFLLLHVQHRNMTQQHLAGS